MPITGKRLMSLPISAITFSIVRRLIPGMASSFRCCSLVRKGRNSSSTRRSNWAICSSK